jgi:CBS domain-containing protein
VRLTLAGITALAAWQAFVGHRLSAVWPALPAVGFVVCAILHVRVIDRLERAGRARQLYERGKARLDGMWAGTGPDGTRFLDDHPFARDLDLFGPASLFQLLDTARTQAGEGTLAGWLRAGAGIEEVRARQAAVTELASKVDFREELAVLAAESHVSRTNELKQWATSPAANLSRLHAVVFGACATVSASLVVLVLTEMVPSTALLVWILLQSGIVGIWRGRILAALANIDTASHDLALMSALLERIEREPFTSVRLEAVRGALFGDGVPPSRRIAQLERLVSLHDQATLNPLMRPIGALFVVRSQVAVAIDRWHATHGTTVTAWLRAVGEIEALSALATYAYEHPADPFPTIVDDGAVFDAAALGHPLMSERVAVRNDVRLGGGFPHALIVSGSNMSGKSTLLRAVGVNIVLALAGAPVRATSVRMSPLAVGATLRVDDSLQAGHSRFYAEILRIRAIVELLRAPQPLLFLLDEIFGGTNSRDRHAGADAIVRVLVEGGAIGLVTTHDLALAEIADGLNGRVANVHFEDRLENGAMVFDYHMRPGVVERSNALELMRAIGLKV